MPHARALPPLARADRGRGRGEAWRGERTHGRGFATQFILLRELHTLMWVAGFITAVLSLTVRPSASRLLISSAGPPLPRRDLIFRTPPSVILSLAFASTTYQLHLSFPSLFRRARELGE